MKQNKAIFVNSPHIVKGSLFAIFAFFCMATFGVLTKIASALTDPIWVSFITYCAAAFSTILFIIPQGKVGIQSTRYRYLFARGLIGTSASFLYMASMHFIPIINSTLLFNTAPIFIPILTVSVLQIRIPKRIWFAVSIGFIGILIIIRPHGDILTEPGNLIGLASGIALAIAYLIMKYLTATETGLRIIFYYFCTGVLMQIPLLWLMNTLPSLESAFISALCGLTLMTAELCIIRAYRYATASAVGVYQYCAVAFVAIYGWFIWKQSPGIWDIAGILLVSAAGIFIITTGSTDNKAK
jgi:drug/metabolite transporter (DMT)-like permease